ncbi:hypothetical protein LTSEUGA_0529 [Salmonella enterica subsp. enterica serovar Uganda str. R8-3404]|uniref:Uncharacterized protein n=1 Tax=Salmonella enterica subsp. enterica serovar Uganda str. R8-3404 TaxID=913083 RepID=A0A6C8H9A2_SALET|nr:hypothetical protein LTSEUGA_0529 [Salmonella enterica subsp. enterica serovar Uganda str. R8-3404]
MWHCTTKASYSGLTVRDQVGWVRFGISIVMARYAALAGTLE